MRLRRASCAVFAGAGSLAVACAPSVGAAASTMAPAQSGDRTQEIDLIADIIYDSAVAGSGTTLANLRRIRQSDEIFEPSIRVNIARPIGRETVYLQGDIGYDFYRLNHVLNRENIDIRPGILAPIGLCQTSVSGEYGRAQSELSELALSPSGPVLAVTKNLREIKEIGGGASCGRATGLGFNANASETWVANSSVTQSFTNAQTFSGSSGVEYRRPSLGSISLFGAYSHTDYPDRAGLAALLMIPGLSSGYNTVSGGLSWSRRVGARLEGNASISYTSLNPIGTNSGKFSGLTYSAGLNYRVTPRILTALTISRATVPSIRLNSSYSIDELYAGNVSYRLGSRITLGANASFAHNSYQGLALGPSFDLTDEKIYTVAGNADFKLNRRMSFGLSVEHIQRDANFAGLSYPDTRVNLTTRASF